METCEYARQNAENKRAVELELHEAGVLHLAHDGDWFRPLITAAFEKNDRELEKTNISKYVSVLAYADRKGVAAAGLRDLLAAKPISEIVGLEAEARREVKGTRATRPDQALEAAIVQHRKPIELPAGIELSDRFTVLVIERTDEGPRHVAQATQTMKEIRRYFADELPRRGRKPVAPATVA